MNEKKSKLGITSGLICCTESESESDSVQSTVKGIEGKLLLVKLIYIYLWVFSIKLKFPENSVEI